MEYGITMEFKEVENINKEVIVKIKDTIHLKDLLPYVKQWSFSVMTIQSIQADINNHGQAYAVIQFLDAVKRRPRSFPKLVAALKHIHDYDIYDIFIKQIRKYFKNNPNRLAVVLSLIAEEERLLGITEDHDDGSDVGSVQSSSSGNVSSSRGVLAGGTDGQSSGSTASGTQWSEDIYRRDGNTASRDPPNRSNITANPPVAHTPVRSNAQGASSSSSSPDSNSPGATGYDKQNLGQFSSSDTPALDPVYAGASISSLKANVYRMLGQRLEKRNTHGDDNDPWWNHIISNGDLNVSRKEQKQIGKEESPGVEFLDILDNRNYTLQDLDRLFTQFQVTEALNVLRQHQNKVVGDRTSNQANNLNKNQVTKADAKKDMNITAQRMDVPVSVPQTDAPEGPKEENTTDIQLLQKQAGRAERNSSSRTQLNSSASNQSFESNTDNSLPSIEDNSLKGTTAVQAHGDPDGIQSQPNPEDEARKLQNDRVHQFDLDPGAIDNTSYIPVNRRDGAGNNNLPTGQTGNDNDGNIPCALEGQITNRQAPDQTVHTCADALAEPNNQNGSSGNIPYLSGLQSSYQNPSNEEPGQHDNNEPTGVVNIPPRSLTDSGMSADVPQRTGVNVVPPSIESQYSREDTVDSSLVPSGDSGNNESLGSMNLPDLVQSECSGNTYQDTDNVASDLNNVDSDQ